MISRFEQFSFVISGIYRYIQKIERDEMEKCGYKGSYAQYLTVMYSREEGVTASQLCQLCDKDKAAVSRVIAEMEQKGLVSRQGGSYRTKLTLTDKGWQTAEFVCERARSAVAAVELPEKSREQFYKTLEFIAGRLQTISKEGLPQANDKNRNRF